MRLCDFTFAFPALLLAIMLTAVFGAGVVNAIIAIGVFNVPVFAKLTRAVGQGGAGARLHAGGPRGGKGAGRHRLRARVAECRAGADRPGDDPVRGRDPRRGGAVLSGSWRAAPRGVLGSDVEPKRRQQMFCGAPRLAVFPGLAVALAVLGLNLLGDGLRDLLDPRLRARR